MMAPAVATRNALNNFNKKVAVKGITTGILPTAVPTANDKSLMQGRIPESGCLCVGSSLAATITIKVWQEADRDWWTPGSGSGDSAKVFASAKMFDYFYAQPGTPYFLYSSVGSNVCWDNGDDANYKGV
jgi:hypothetical protein